MQPREKLKERGVESLTNEEIISVLISSGIKGFNYRKISRKVYKTITKVDQNSTLELNDLLEIDGLGDAKAMRILASIELGKRLFGNSEKVLLTNSEEAYNYLRNISRYRQERLIAVFLNARYEVILKKIVTIGTVDNLGLYNKDIIFPAIKYNSAYVIICHNHPSGDSTPSEQDISFTKQLMQALELVNVSLLEHIIVSSSGWSRVEIDK